MKYYLIAGEASGDLHAARLISALRARDVTARFRFFGGDEMSRAAGERGERVRHYRELAYMGFVPVLLHLPAILRNMSVCRRDIARWRPDAVIFVDYAGFNLAVAKRLRRLPDRPRLYYYIAPKIWAWNERRIRNFKRDIDELFSILPFEEDFFAKKHGYPVHYVGNPTADEVREFRSAYSETAADFRRRHGLAEDKPVIALLPGSRRQEIKGNLPAMLAAAAPFAGDYRLVVAGAPGVDKEFYTEFLNDAARRAAVRIVFGETYELLSHSAAALVTSGTATLETALLRVPQAVCYRTPAPRLCRWGFEHILKVKYISLVNLVADREVVAELFADRFSVANISAALRRILPGGEARERMLEDYDEVARRLGDRCAPDNAARIITELTAPTERGAGHGKGQHDNKP